MVEILLLQTTLPESGPQVRVIRDIMERNHESLRWMICPHGVFPPSLVNVFATDIPNINQSSFQAIEEGLILMNVPTSLVRVVQEYYRDMDMTRALGLDIQKSKKGASQWRVQMHMRMICERPNRDSLQWRGPFERIAAP